MNCLINRNWVLYARKGFNIRCAPVDQHSTSLRLRKMDLFFFRMLHIRLYTFNPFGVFVHWRLIKISGFLSPKPFSMNCLINRNWVLYARKGFNIRCAPVDQHSTSLRLRKLDRFFFRMLHIRLCTFNPLRVCGVLMALKLHGEGRDG